MKTPRTQIAQIVAKRSLKGEPSRKLSREVAAYMLSERRTSEMSSLLRDVQNDWAEAGIVEVLASSVYPLTANVKTDIKRQIKGLYPNAKQIIVTEVRDPSVIRGVRLSLAKQQLDLSVETKLNKFKQLTA